MVPLAYTIVSPNPRFLLCDFNGLDQGTKYNIKNVALLGACAIPGAIGEMSKIIIIARLNCSLLFLPPSPQVGAPLSGYLSDRIVVQSRRSRGGVWYPEDRLRATLNGALVLVPLSMVLSGIVTKYVDGPIGLALDLACFFLNGFGVSEDGFLHSLTKTCYVSWNWC